MTVKDIYKFTTQFKDFCAKHGGTDDTEKQLLRPISKANIFIFNMEWHTISKMNHLGHRTQQLLDEALLYFEDAFKQTYDFIIY